jgi:hypothetical protein
VNQARQPEDHQQALRRASWRKTLHQWHWVSSALCLVTMLLFSVTGLTLNNASHIEAQPKVHTFNAELPPALLQQLNASPALAQPGSAALPLAVRQWFAAQWQVAPTAGAAEWSEHEVYLAMPRPGGDAWLRIDRRNGQAEYEDTDRGWVAYFNDLHKGRHTGVAWRWLMDLFCVACLVFCITGLLILKLHATTRPTVWPTAALGLVLPAILALLFIH